MLSLEPLLATIQANQEIRGVEVAGQEHKVSAFANNMMLYVSNPGLTLPNILAEFEKYGEISNLKINQEKTEILNVSVPLAECRDLRSLYPFAWKQRGLKYLGVFLSTSEVDLYQDNYLPLLNKIKQDLRGYPADKLSWFGRINDIRMMTLPKALLVFQTLPINIPKAYFKT